MLLLALLSVVLVCASGSTSSSTPKSLRFSLTTPTAKIAAAAASGLGLYLGKKVYDGPVFDEAVSLKGQNVIITGGNTGLGLESAIKLAQLGGNVIILSRASAKTDQAVETIKKQSGSSLVSAIPLDLGDLKSIKQCADELKKRVDKIDVALLNAGIMAVPTRELTKDGYESHMGVNHLGHFALLRELFPLVKKAPAGRVVTVSSSAHLLGKLDQTDLLLAKEGAYSPWPAYGNSKLANILFTRELARRLKEKRQNPNVVAVVLHPGACRTELGRYVFDPASIPKFLYPVLGVVGAPLLYFTKDQRMGAQTQIFLSASSRVSSKDNGLFFDNSKPADTSAEAKDVQEAKWLWAESEKLTNGKFEV